MSRATDEQPTQRREVRRGLFVGGALGLLAMALLIFLVAWIGYGFGCQEENTELCGARTVQFVIALCGLVPAALTVMAAWRARYRGARFWLAVTLLTYVLWAILLAIPDRSGL
jgi:hypothetical protein